MGWTAVVVGAADEGLTDEGWAAEGAAVVELLAVVEAAAGTDDFSKKAAGDEVALGASPA
jgi:hypothetical protein